MKNFTKELKAILKEDPGAPIMSPDEVVKRANTMVILTNQAPPKLLALAGSSRKAILLNFKPLMITFPDQKGVYKVQPDDIVFENHHSGRDVTEAGAEETSYEKFFASAMKKFGVSSPIELNPEDTKKFFNYVDKNWDAEEESDGSKNEILPVLGAIGRAAVGGAMALGRGVAAAGKVAGGVGDAIDTDEDTNEIAPALAAVAGAAGAGAAGKVMDRISGDDNEDVSTGKVGKKDKGSYRRAYKLALKKYQIHSADELDTPAERKGFTAYVDKLWKGGEVKDHALPEVSSEEKARRKEAERKERERREKTQAANVKKRVPGSQKTAAEKDREKLAAQRERNQKALARKVEQEKRRREQEQQSKEREREQAAREKERKQKAKEKDNGDNGADDDDDKKKEKGNGVGSFLKQAGGAAAQAAKQQAAQYDVKESNPVSEAIKSSTMYGVVKADSKGDNSKFPAGEVVFKGNAKKARSMVKDLKRKGHTAYVINSPSAKVGQRAYHKKGYGLKIEAPTYKPNLSYNDAKDPGESLAKQMKKNIELDKKEVSPPDREHQVKGIKKHMAQKKGKDKIPKTYVDKKTGKRKKTNPWALAWAQYDKYGVPSRVEKD